MEIRHMLEVKLEKQPFGYLSVDDADYEALREGQSSAPYLDDFNQSYEVLGMADAAAALDDEVVPLRTKEVLRHILAEVEMLGKDPAFLLIWKY